MVVTSSEHRRDKGPVNGTAVLSTPAAPARSAPAQWPVLAFRPRIQRGQLACQGISAGQRSSELWEGPKTRANRAPRSPQSVTSLWSAGRRSGPGSTRRCERPLRAMASARPRAWAASRPNTTIRVLWSSMGRRPSSLAFLTSPTSLPGSTVALRDIARAWEGPRVELLSASRVEEHRGPVVLKHVLHALKLNLGEAAEGPPYRDAELIAPHVREAGGQ